MSSPLDCRSVSVNSIVDELFNLGITSGINYSKETSLSVLVSGDNKTSQISTFQEAGLMPLLQENLRRSGYVIPTPVQKNTIPAIMAGRDIMVCAQTGSGKIGSFMIPIIHKLMSSKREASSAHCLSPQALILAPSRDLAMIIVKEARKFVQGTKIKIDVVCHGMKTELFKKLKNGCNILVATASRLSDYIDMCRVNFKRIQWLVFYETGILMENYVKTKKLMKCLDQQNMPDKNRRQTIALSVALPEHIQIEAMEFMGSDYLFISVPWMFDICGDSKMLFFKAGESEKKEKVVEILKATEQSPKDKTLIFVARYSVINFLLGYLNGEGLSATGINKDMSQLEREDALYDFKNEVIPILVITDEFSRGLDLVGIAHVINYDMPREEEEWYTVDKFLNRLKYLRRGEKPGKATSLYDPVMDMHAVSHLSKSGISLPDWLVEEAEESSGIISDYDDEW